MFSAIYFRLKGANTYSAALGGPLRQIFQASSCASDFSYASCLERRKDSTATVLDLAGQLFQRDLPLDLSMIIPKGSLLTDVPSYSWSHNTSYWTESRAVREWLVTVVQQWTLIPRSNTT